MDDKMEEDSDVEESKEEEISNPDVVTKYKTTADIANRVLSEVLKECVPGKLIVDVCAFGDKLILDAVSSIYTKGKIEKGVAFPTCISLNHCVGHFSPLAGDTTILNEGDLAKVELGVQIDGFISLIAQSIVVGSTASDQKIPITDRKADVLCAAYYASECAHRLIKPGMKNTDVTNAILKVARQFECQPMEGVLSHQMKRYVIDGNKVIINKSTLEQKVDEFEFENNQVYAVDIVMSTGEGKSKEMDTRTTVYKRAVDQNYLLKMKASRYVFNEINARFPTFPFTLRALDEKRGRLGITECLSHGLVSPYPVLYEKPGEYVAQVTFTALVLPSGTLRLSTISSPQVQSDKKIVDPEILSILQLGTKRTKKHKSKKKKSTKEGNDVPAEKNPTKQSQDSMEVVSN